MKTRTGYVSNSSSSSYIVIPDDVYNDKILSNSKDYNKIRTFLNFSDDNDENGLSEEGEMEFGWQMKNYHDLESKWNWLVLQAYYGGNPFINIINDFLNNLHSNLKVNWAKIEEQVDNVSAYIDHQSVEPADTFDKVNKIGIAEFLANEKCYIHNSNDNEKYGDY